MNYFERATALMPELVENRRYFHTNAEVGVHNPMAQAYVLEKLKACGIDAKPCGEGVAALIGKGEGKTILLRADMDALPMAEQSGEAFACKSGTAAHTCGHDFHAAMLLTAAKMLKENEAELEGAVKLMFQTGEETFEGGKNMIENGILENPVPDVALAYHVSPGKMPVGLYMYNNANTMMFSVDGFKITVHGKGGHGAYPHTSVDPINIAIHIHLALQELIARESDPTKACVLTVGKFQAGSAANIIPETCVMEGTIRSNNPEERSKLVRRMREVAQRVAAVYYGQVEVDMTSECPPLICDPKVVNEMVGYMKELGIPNLMGYPGVQASASEDFALVAEKIPSAFMYLSAGYMDERGGYAAHNPKARFNEEVLPIGAACLAHCAQQWLKNNK